LLSAAPEQFATALRLARSEHMPLHEAERRELGITHEEAGKIIAGIWHLPPKSPTSSLTITPRIGQPKITPW